MTYPTDDPGRRDQGAPHSDETTELPTGASTDDPQPAPTVDDMTVVHPLSYPSPARTDAGTKDAPQSLGAPRTLRQWGPSVPTVLAGMLLIAVSAGVAFLRLADTTEGPSAAAITLAVGAALIVAGLLAMLAGFQRRRTA